jgi:hypothetical protein
MVCWEDATIISSELDMQQPMCIFCRSTTNQFSTREHIFPESLGGEDWALLPNGLFCDKCQNIFGSSVEQQALGSYPFTQFRILFGVPTKKKKAPWFVSSEGKLTASLGPKGIIYEPFSQFEEGFIDGTKTQIRIVAEPSKPEMICRFLLKMAVEVIASNDQHEVFDPKYDEARNFALNGSTDKRWWYFQHEDLKIINHRIQNKISGGWVEPVKLEVVTIAEKNDIFHLKLFYLDLLVPLFSHIQPPTRDSYHEPEQRLFIIDDSKK